MQIWADRLTKILNHTHVLLKAGSVDVSNRCVPRSDAGRFESISHTYAHQTGDSVLGKVGQRLVMICRDGETVVRYGGEECVAFLPITPYRTTRRRAERLCAAGEFTELDLAGLVPLVL